MEPAMTVEELAASRGAAVVSSDDVVVGDVEAIYYDDATDRPEWIGIGTGIIATRRVLAPVEGARLTERGLEVPFAADVIKNAPEVDADRIEVDTERALAAHYGIEWREPPPSRDDRDAGDGSRSADDWFEDDEPEATLTRHEEELYVEKTVEQAGVARLRKWVETEPIELEVELDRERVEVVREVVNEPVDAEIREAEVEIPVSAEKAVVHKETIAKERISVEKQVERDVETVRDELRKEQIEVESDVERPQ